jgi:membrane fusion protein (multidrug efflux system)
MSEDSQKKDELQKAKRKPNPGAGISEDAGDEESPESVPLYRNFKIVVPLFVVVLGISIFAWNWYIGMRDFVSTDDAYIDGNRVSISSKIMGRIDTLLADEGDSVHYGKVVARIDNTDLLAQEVQSKAALALARENISLAKVSLDKAQADLKRTSTQYRENIVPKEQYDHAESEYESARARYNIAVAQAVAARAQLGVVETQLKNTVIECPMDGIVSRRWVLSGDVVQPGQPIFSVYDLGNIWITANLEETKISTCRMNDSVEVVVDSYPDRSFYGYVFQIGSSTTSQFSLIPPNNASGNFTKVTQRIPIKISVRQVPAHDLGPVMLLPGMSVEIKIKVR